MSESTEALPSTNHVAIIMDGNGRWAKSKGLPRSAGHYAGVKSVRKIIRACESLNVKQLTLFAFSSENWQRPKDEVNELMSLFIKTLNKELPEIHKNNIRLRFIGDKTAFTPKLKDNMLAAEELTQNNTAFGLNIAANYGGRWDITQAAKTLAKQVQDGTLEPEHITEVLLSEQLSTHAVGDPDLLIRTGNESRVSNFLMWQIAYSELYFSETMWPDFSPKLFSEALNWFHQRQRRFGKTSEQVSTHHA